jgi:hypothetical protein
MCTDEACFWKKAKLLVLRLLLLSARLSGFLNYRTHSGNFAVCAFYSWLLTLVAVMVV